MALTAKDVAQIVEENQRTNGDTGSPEVQIALLTARIKYLTEHMKVHAKDFHNRYGLTNLVAKRRKLMAYLKRINFVVYQNLLKKLGIRG